MKNIKKLLENKTAVIICTVVIILAVTAGISQLFTRESAEDTEVPAAVVVGEEDSVSEKPLDASDTEENMENENTEDAVSQEETSGDAETVDGGTAAAVQPGDSSVTTQRWEDVESTFPDAETESTEFTLPYTIPGTSLTIENITSYDGIYLEDGSDSEISGVTVVVLKNEGNTNVEYTGITLDRDGTTLHFTGSDIPAGGTAVIQEAEKIGYVSGTYSNCSADVAELDNFEMSEEKITVEESGEQTLTVTNISGEIIPAVRIFYKFYMEEENVYVGGITYTAKVTELAAGESREITPSHYSSGSSRIMMIRTYDTTE